MKDQRVRRGRAAMTHHEQRGRSKGCLRVRIAGRIEVRIGDCAVSILIDAPQSMTADGELAGNGDRFAGCAVRSIDVIVVKRSGLPPMKYSSFTIAIRRTPAIARQRRGHSVVDVDDQQTRRALCIRRATVTRPEHAVVFRAEPGGARYSASSDRR
jgi:hypothetical protein